jgi:hypothetical protein
LLLFIVPVLLAIGACSPERHETLTDRSVDLAAIESGFLAVDKSFSDQARAEARKRFQEIRVSAGRMSDAEFELAIAELAALSDNGHSTLYASHWAEKFNRLAVRFYFADDGFFVADAQPGFEQFLDRKVETLDGKTLAELREISDTYQNGTEGYRDQTLYYFIESPEILQAAGVGKSATETVLTFADGETATIPLSSGWPAPEGVWTILPQAREIELNKAGRVSGDPLYLQSPDDFYRVKTMPELDAVYIQFRANVDFNREIDMYEATRSTIEELQQQKPQYVIVDERFNLGGDLNTTRDLMETLPHIVGPDGRVFVITSGRTFSAGIASVGYLKQAGGERVTIVGKPVGDRLEFWAEGDPIELPQAGAYVGVATERHNYMTGCPEDDCHGSIQLHPISIDNLRPDIRPEFTYGDLVSGRDPYLDAIKGLIDSGDGEE